MNARHKKLHLLGIAALAVLTLAAAAHAQEEPDELDDLDEPAVEPASPNSTPAPAGAASPSSADGTNGTNGADATTAFGADEPGASPEIVAQARAHFEQGVEYYAEGDYRAALIELQRAYELHRTYKLLYNLGQVAYELRDYAGAERYFRDYLAKGGHELTPERIREVKQELARLHSRVASLRVSADQPDASFRVDDRVIVHPQGAVRVSAGRRLVRAEKAGFAPVERIVDVTGGEELDVQLSFGPPLIAASGVGTDAASGGSSRLPWVTGIMAGVLAIAAGGVGYAAYQDVNMRDNALRTYTTHDELDSLSKQAHTKALVADVLLGAALVSTAATIVLVLSGGSKTERLTPQASAAGPSQLNVRF